MATEMLHTCLKVKDLEAVSKFMTEGLGLIETHRTQFPTFVMVYFATHEGGHEIELRRDDDTSSYGEDKGYDHFALGCDDIQAMREQHIKQGYEVSEFRIPNGQTRPKLYFVTGPEGYKVEILQNNY